MPYRTRRVQFLELWTESDWQVKVYGIAADADRPRPELVEAAKVVAARTLPATSGDTYGIAFLTVHDGADGTWVLVDWWAQGNLLHHHLFGGSLSAPFELELVTGGLTACTWELAVIAFERQAWLDRVFAPDDADVPGYLDERLDALV